MPVNRGLKSLLLYKINHYMTPEELKAEVIKVLGAPIVRRILREVDTSSAGLNALAPELNFDEHSILICIYKDIKNLAYEKLYEKVKAWHKIAKSTLQENSKKIRRCLRDWAGVILVPDSLVALEKASRRHKRPPRHRLALELIYGSIHQTLLKQKLLVSRGKIPNTATKQSRKPEGG